MSRALVDLPVARWARLFSRGTVRVDGALAVAVALPGLEVRPGPVCVELLFSGGDDAVITSSRLTAGSEGCRPLERPAEAVDVLRRLDDVEVEARTETERPLTLQLAGDVRVVVDPGVVVTVSAAAAGPATALSLARPIVVGFSGAGAKLQYGGLHRVSRWVDLRLERAILAPDGRVRLHGRGPRGLDFTARAGLSTASVAVTRLVRRGERFRSLRGILRLP